MGRKSQEIRSRFNSSVAYRRGLQHRDARFDSSVPRWMVRVRAELRQGAVLALRRLPVVLERDAQPDVGSSRGGGVACYGPGRREDGISFGVFRVWREAWRCPSFPHTPGYGGRHGHEAPKDRAATRGALTFDPVSRGTRMRWSWVIEPHGGLKLMTPMLARIGRRQEQAIWANLKRHLDARD